MLRWWCVLLIYYLHSCGAVIYHLNESEYVRMPPLTSLDDYDSCLLVEGSTYCLLQLTLYAEPGNQLMRIITEYSDHKVKHYNHAVIDRGVCVRKTCQKYMNNVRTPEELRGALEACLNASLHREYGLSARVSRLYACERDNEPRHVDGWDWAVLGLLLGLLLVNVAGTVYDHCLTKQWEGSQNEVSGNWILLSFSVTRNWKYLTNTSFNPKLRDLNFFHGIRVLSNLCIILAHVMLVFSNGFVSNSLDFEETFELPSYLLLYNGMMIVQVFFFFSGFLAVYMLRLQEKSIPFTVWDISKLFLLRISRLVPSLAVAVALSATWVRHAGSGPLWNLFVRDALVKDCRSYWWQNLLFVNNYMPDNKYCLVPTWQIAADVQVYLVCVPAYLMTRGRTRRLVLGGLLVFGVIAPALHTMMQDLDAITITPEFYRTLVGGTFRFQHILGHTNLPCFIMGMATADVVRGRNWQKKGGLGKRRWFGILQCLAIVMFALVLYSGSWFYGDGPRAPLLARAAYSAAIRVVLGIMSALTGLAFFNTSRTFLKSLFEWRGLTAPSRMSYSVCLLHMVVVHVAMGSRTKLPHFSGVNLLSTYACILLVSYLVSLPFYLMVEAPFNEIVKKSFAQKRFLLTPLESENKKLSNKMS